MRRRPNPWIALPSLGLGLVAGALGWVVTDVSCRQPDPDGIVSPCIGWSVFFSVVSFVIVTVSVAVLLALVFRSLSEWQERSPE